MNGFRRFALFISYIVLSLPLASAQQNRIAARIDDNHTVRLSGRVHPNANPQNDRGAVDSSFQLPGITLLLKSSASQQSDLEQTLQQQQDPSSSNFHKWLTPEQYADRFGVSANDLARVTDWLKSQGFTIANIARS